MGINSYLFRFQFFEYLDEHQSEPDIQTKDDFVCQHCTEWSGLGVIDVLAETLNLPAEDKATLRTWYERHWSFFRVLTRHEEGDEVKFITARNLVNGQPYTQYVSFAMRINNDGEGGILVGEGHLADRFDAGLDGVALGHVNGSEHPHFQIGNGISHE